jgi:hypothetical protein
MSKRDCERLIQEYVSWLGEQVEITEIGEHCQISTPFLDRHNDAIEIYVEQRNGALLLTDDGRTVADLSSSGLEFNTPKRRAHLQAILHGFGVSVIDDELKVSATPADFPQRKHSLIQAILAVNDMFVMAEEQVLSLFKEDVARFLELTIFQRLLILNCPGKAALIIRVTSEYREIARIRSACCVQSITLTRTMPLRSPSLYRTSECFVRMHWAPSQSSMTL